MPKRPAARRRIGFLTHAVWDPVGAPLWQGALEGAREAGADLVCFIGNDLGAHRLPFEAEANLVYDLAGKPNVEGLVVSASSIGGFIGADGMREFYRRFGALPIVSVSGFQEGIPAVLSDGYRGMYDLVSHCLTVHGCRRPAFLPGPWGSGEVRERYRAYTDALRDHGLPLDPALVAPAGEWNWLSGQRCLAALLDAGADCDAVFVCNDRMATGAIDELWRRDLDIPDRIIVTGFDDTLDALFAKPPLSTVHQPLFDLARRAVALLLARLDGDEVPERTLLPTVPVLRRSCGCGGESGAPPAEVAAGNRRDAKPRRDAKTWRSGFRTRFRSERAKLARKMRAALRTVPGALKPDGTARLLDALAADVDDPASARFAAAWQEIIDRLVVSGRTIDLLQAALFAIEPGTLAAAGVGGRERVAALFSRARAAVGDATMLAEIKRTWIKSQRLHLSLELINSLNAATDVASVADFLDKSLPGLGIPGCVIAVYENPEAPLDAVRPLLVNRNGARDTAAEQAGPYRSAELVPAGFFAQEAPRAYTVQPLFFQERRIGFVVFAIGLPDGDTYENVRQALCSNLQRVHVMGLREEARLSREKAYAEVERQVQERTRQLEIEIGERRRVEEALLQEQYLTRALMDNTPDFIYFKDAASRFIRINEALARHLGLAAPAAGVGKTDEDFYDNRFAAKTRADERRVMETGRPAVGLEEQELWPDGRSTWASTTKLPLRDADGRIVGTIGISRDITGRKRAEAEVRRLNEELEDRVRERTAELEEANRELEGFSYSVSHDLRAPLRAMDGFARMLMEEYAAQLPAGALRHLSTIVASARQMGRLIDGLLAFSRLSRQALSSQPVATAALVREALESLHGEYADRRVEIVVGDLPECRGDPMLLRQVWVNLISNALKFTRRRPDARVEIGSRKITGKLVYFVKDNGVGFDMRYADKLFGVFQRLHRAEDYEGTGVGLAAIQRIIHRHGGRIWAEAKPDQGATFYFII